MPLGIDDFTRLKSQWSGGCILSVHDSVLADAWIDTNYEHKCLVALREHNIGGPVASMLSVELPALAIFGTISIPLIQIADELAELSGFLVMVRPLSEDPSHHFK